MTTTKLEGFGKTTGFGQRLALVVVDMSTGFTDPASPLACDLDGVVVVIADLLAAARCGGHTVIFTKVAYDDAGAEAAALFIEKVPALLALAAGSQWAEIDPRLAPLESESVLTKLWASAFFGTPLDSLLSAAEIDTVVIVGASTSGCVRSTAVDCLQHGYRTIVCADGVGDRNQTSHEVALADLQSRYADVVEAASVADYLRDSQR